mmetsp:Transcript_8091/g.25856  ORF Transcript_8091/g.25856 Transcript_8091/m.25856 type:complete len:251 (+) Transcript_8091:626-1378(+)
MSSNHQFVPAVVGGTGVCLAKGRVVPRDTTKGSRLLKVPRGDGEPGWRVRHARMVDGRGEPLERLLVQGVAKVLAHRLGRVGAGRWLADRVVLAAAKGCAKVTEGVDDAACARVLVEHVHLLELLLARVKVRDERVHQAVRDDDARAALCKVVVAATRAGRAQGRCHLKAAKDKLSHGVELSKEGEQVGRKDHRVVVYLDVPAGVRSCLDHGEPLAEREAGQVGTAVDARVRLARRPRNGQQRVRCKGSL